MTATVMRLAAGLPSTLVLWDVDHTLIENGGVSNETYALAFELITGMPPAVRPVTDGRTDFQIMRELLSANSVSTDGYDDIDQFADSLKDAMKCKAPELPDRGYVLPGALEALRMLNQCPAVIQSVLTGNIAFNASAKLSPFDLERWLDLTVGGYGSDDTVRANLVNVARQKVHDKYQLEFDSASTVLVGDTPLDVKAAHAGGAQVIAVATGRYSVDELDQAGADVVLASLRSLEDFVRALAGVRTKK